MQISLHFWWEKVMLHVSIPHFQWVVCCSTHGLSANQCSYWSSAFHTEESITQYFYMKLTNSVQNVTPLLGRRPSLDSDFKWRRTSEQPDMDSKDNEQLLQQLKMCPSGSSASEQPGLTFSHYLHGLHMKGSRQPKQTASLYLSLTTHLTFLVHTYCRDCRPLH